MERSLRAIGFIPTASPDKISRMLDGYKPDLVFEFNAKFGTTTKQRKDFAAPKKIPLLLIVHDTNEDFEPVFRWRESLYSRRIVGSTGSLKAGFVSVLRWRSSMRTGSAFDPTSCIQSLILGFVRVQSKCRQSFASRHTHDWICWCACLWLWQNDAEAVCHYLRRPASG